MRDWLKRVREEKGISQEQISKKMGVTQSSYSMIETGERHSDMSLSVMQKISDALDVSIEYIIEQEKM